MGASLVVAAVLMAGMALAAPAGESAPTTPANPYQVTFVARECPAYSDITANLNRNNIQESLQDLGANSAYQPGQAISPAVETPNQPACTPLDGWQFTFGSGIAGKTDNLSTVSNPGSPITVQPSVPLLDAQGNPTGQTIAAATTVTLTQAQVSAAMNHNLWVQGGTPADPLVTSSFGSKNAFGALRCAIDNLNGDNVEWVGFPSGATNVFCYYYAVDQSPAPGTIVVQKQLGPGETGTNVFQFQGDISYNPGGAFEVPVSGPAPSSGSVSFVRDSGEDWTFQELPYAGFGLTSLTCVSANSTSTFTINGASASVDLGSGDTATCTYVDTRNVTDLSVFKQTTGGVGGPFDFTVTPPSGTPTDFNATTTEQDAPVQAGTITDATVGTYTVAESLPAPTGAGSWSVSAFDCNGTPGPVSPTQTVDVTSVDEALECTFTNLFTPGGSLTITKTTTGGTGITDFVVTPVTDDDPAAPPPGDVSTPVLTAITTEPGVPVTATQSAGAPLNPLTLGQYAIVEEGPDDTAAGTWAPVSISCNGAATDPSSSAAIVTLTAADPQVTCAFTNAFAPVTPTTTTTSTVPTTVTTAPSVSGGTAAASSSAPGLAVTGADVGLPLALALALALAGMALMAIDRVRRARRPAPGALDDDPPT
jgi:hypothetical protein